MSADPSDLPDLTEVDPELLVSDDVLDSMSEDELAAYVEMLRQDAEEWKLQPHQQAAEDLSMQVDEIMFGGSAGPGKSEWLCHHMYTQCLKFPGLRVLALRRTFPQLRRSLIERTLLRFDPKVAKYMPSEKRWKFNNGSEIEFGFCDAEEDYRHYLSAEADLLVFEELTEFTWMQYKMVSSRCRTTTKKLRQGIRPHIISATNPGQVGHGWVRDYFVHATDYGKKVHEIDTVIDGKTYKRRIGFMPAKVQSNRYIDPAYLRNLATLPEHQRRMYMDGDWDVFEGQFFPEWNRDIHVVEPFPIPPEWPRVRGIDYGFAKPYACLWMAFDQDGTCWVYREDYATQLTATEQAKRIVKMSVYPDYEVYGRKRNRPEEIDRTVADPSVFNKTGNGTSIAQMYHAAGLPVTKGMNARIDGWNRVRDYLRGDPANPETGPAIRIFSTCTNLIRTLPVMVFDDTRSEDMDTTLEDHACFPAGTMITTAEGDKSIESVKVGDLVWTRGGWAPVAVAELTSPMEDLLEVELANGRRLVGTGNHPVWTQRGWVPLANLTVEDTPFACIVDEWIPLPSSPPPGKTSLVSSTTCQPGTCPGKASDSTGWSGPTTSARFRRGTTSITSTTIPSTTTRRISSRFSRASTQNTTRSASAKGIRLPAVRRGLRGIGAPLAESGIRKWPRALGKSERPSTLTNAPSAARSSSPSTPGATTAAAPLPATPLDGRLRASTTSTGSARSAGLPSGATSTTEPSLAPSRVLRSSAAGQAPVYNLSVEGEFHEYLANGILVSNCDALRYALMARNRSARKGKPAVDPRSPAARLERAVRKRQQEKRDHQILGNWR